MDRSSCNDGPPDEPTGPPAMGGDGHDDVEAGKLARLIEAVGVAERHVAEAVVLAGELAGSGVAERVEGQSLEVVLATACRLTGADRKTLITAGQVLADMPCLRGLFETGEVAWGLVRLATMETRRLSRADRQAVDARLAATVAERGSVGSFEPDELAEAVRAAADDQRDIAVAERDERDGVAHSFLAVQRDLFGGSRWYGELDATLTATAIAALDAASRPPHRDHPGDGDEGGDGHARPPSGWTRGSRARDYAEGLGRLCGEWLAGIAADRGEPTVDRDGDADRDGGGPTGGAEEGGGGGGPVTGRRARPAMTVIVDLADVTASNAGVVDVGCRGMVPRLTAATVEALACSADIRAVVCDGVRPLATTAKVTAADIPEATRRAVEARDGGCRWAGCDAPLVHTEIHHLVERAVGGAHHPDNLVCLCRRDHLHGHAHGWTLTLDLATGQLTGSHHGRAKWHTLPRNTPLTHPGQASVAEPDDEPDGNPGGDRDPPRWGPDTDHDGNPLPF